MAPVAQRARGTQDILPADQPHWKAMERAAESLAAGWGYQRIETPIFEATEIFVRSAGEGSHVVSKEMYTFTDRGGRSLSLRPEGTAPIVRAYFDGGLDQEPQPVRLYYVGPFFRYDRPQAGRYRELHQFGVEAIGEDHAMLDVEVVQLGWEWFSSLGITGTSLLLNSIGDEVCRPSYRERLRDYYRPHLQEVCDEDRIRFERNPMRLFDCKVAQCQPLKAHAPRIVDHEQTVINTGGDELALRVPFLDEPRRARQERGPRGQRLADSEKGVGRFVEEKGHRRLGPDDERDAVEA